ncbi:recombinase family protein [Kocuria nitroreducens]|uniref:recombinase family protein n=1 Tax=Kocuria nitroreducens TaxID=3058914 RepID=UPI0036DCB3DA
MSARPLCPHRHLRIRATSWPVLTSGAEQPRTVTEGGADLRESGRYRRSDVQRPACHGPEHAPSTAAEGQGALDRLGRSTQNMLVVAEALRGRGAGLRVLNPGGGDVDTATPTVFTVMAAPAQRELEIERERIADSVGERRTAGMDLGGRRLTFTDSQVRHALRLIDSGEPAIQVARDLGMFRAALYRRIREMPPVTAI